MQINLKRETFTSFRVNVATHIGGNFIHHLFIIIAEFYSLQSSFYKLTDIDFFSLNFFFSSKAHHHYLRYDFFSLDLKLLFSHTHAHNFLIIFFNFGQMKEIYWVGSKEKLPQSIKKSVAKLILKINRWEKSSWILKYAYRCFKFQLVCLLHPSRKCLSELVEKKKSTKQSEVCL